MAFMDALKRMREQQAKVKTPGLEVPERKWGAPGSTWRLPESTSGMKVMTPGAASKSAGADRLAAENLLPTGGLPRDVLAERYEAGLSSIPGVESIISGLPVANRQLRESLFNLFGNAMELALAEKGLPQDLLSTIGTTVGQRAEAAGAEPLPPDTSMWQQMREGLERRRAGQGAEPGPLGSTIKGTEPGPLGAAIIPAITAIASAASAAASAKNAFDPERQAQMPGVAPGAPHRPIFSDPNEAAQLQAFLEAIQAEGSEDLIGQLISSVGGGAPAGAMLEPGQGGSVETEPQVPEGGIPGSILDRLFTAPIPSSAEKLFLSPDATIEQRINALSALLGGPNLPATLGEPWKSFVQMLSTPEGDPAILGAGQQGLEALLNYISPSNRLEALKAADPENFKDVSLQQFGGTAGEGSEPGPLGSMVDGAMGRRQRLHTAPPPVKDTALAPDGKASLGIPTPGGRGALTQGGSLPQPTVAGTINPYQAPGGVGPGGLAPTTMGGAPGLGGQSIVPPGITGDPRPQSIAPGGGAPEGPGMGVIPEQPGLVPDPTGPPMAPPMGGQGFAELSGGDQGNFMQQLLQMFSLPAFQGGLTQPSTPLQQQATGAAGEFLQANPFVDTQRIQDTLGEMVETGGRFDLSPEFSALEDINRRRLEEERAQMNEMFGGLGARFGGDIARGQGELTSRYLEQEALQKSELARQSFEAAQGRRMGALPLGGQIGAQELANIGNVYGIGEAQRQIGDVGIQRAMAEFARTQGGLLPMLLQMGLAGFEGDTIVTSPVEG